MYVTRPLSQYRNSPSLAPPEGPNSGILLIQDEEAAESRWCCGLFKKMESVKELPFPQNKILRLTHAVDAGQYEYSDSVYAVLIPVLNQPLSSNQYYIINSRGNRKGLACIGSKEEDNTSSRCCYSVPDPPPQLFDPKNTYQQFQISDYIYCGGPNGFVSKTMAPDGVPPERLSRKGWKAYAQPLQNFEPTEALGLNPSLRARLPELKSADPVVVGKWYCPFIFIREGEVSSQMSNSPYYEMTLQQNWVEIFRCESFGQNKNNGVDVDVYVEREVVSVAGATATSKNVGDGFVWFEPAAAATRVGLSSTIVERVKWEEGRGGFEWVEEWEEEKVRVKRREKFEGVGMWRRFGCYVLVERFVLKRMDGSLVLAWEFRHTHQVRTKWE